MRISDGVADGNKNTTRIMGNSRSRRGGDSSLQLLEIFESRQTRGDMIAIPVPAPHDELK